MIQQFKLIEKINLTHNVFEMVFQGEKHLEMKAGQFVTFLLDEIGGRAYSILRIEGKKIVLIIKKRELDEGGRGGSKIICELNIGNELKGVGPAGHFTLNQNNKGKLFIGTGTGLVPLYNMLVSELENNTDNNVHLLFGIREQEDAFYIKNLERLKNKYSNFDFNIYISRVKDLHQFKMDNLGDKVNSGYTTNFLTKNNLKGFEEFYICGAPTMIESSVDKLKKLHFNEENIYFEKY